MVDGGAASTAVNLHHGHEAIEAHLLAAATVPTLSLEQPVALGTAGALAKLRPWLDGRDVLVTNADAVLPSVDLRAFVDGWDRQRVRLLCVRDAERGDFGDLRYSGVALLPWREVAPLRVEPTGLYEVSWRRLDAEGSLDLVVHDGPFVDCATTADYLAANLLVSGGASVIDPSARVSGHVERSVVWEHAVVGERERLVDAIRTAKRTVLIR